jgi:hypothetical protein
MKIKIIEAFIQIFIVLILMLGPAVGIQWFKQRPNYHSVLNPILSHKKRHPQMPFLPTQSVN